MVYLENDLKEDSWNSHDFKGMNDDSIRLDRGLYTGTDPICTSHDPYLSNHTSGISLSAGNFAFPIQLFKINKFQISEINYLPAKD